MTRDQPPAPDPGLGLESALDAARSALEPHAERLRARGEGWSLDRSSHRWTDGRTIGTVSLLGRPLPADDREVEAVLSVQQDRASRLWNVDAMTATQLDSDGMQSCQATVAERSVPIERLEEALIALIPPLVSHVHELLGKLDAGDRDRIC